MSSKDWVHGTCNEKTGFLFKHDCPHPPAGNCSLCGKPICSEHTHHLDNEACCTLCAKQDDKQRRGKSRSRTGHYEDDFGEPYFYSDHYYDGYGRYRPGYWGYSYYAMSHHDTGMEDFTAADAESLATEGAEDFESDMSES